MKINDLSKTNSLIGQYVSELRDSNVQQDPMRFRKNIERLGWIFAYEISRKLHYTFSNIETPLGEKEMSVMDDEIVISTILRAGVPFHQGFLEMFDRAENAFISAYRKYDEEGNFDIFNGYVTAPDLNNKIVIICDVMLATGASLGVAYNSLMEYGTPEHVHIAAIVCCSEGIEYIKKHVGNKPVTLWAGSIDDELSAKGYIIPGLGDAGDLAFGPKL